MLRFLPLKLGRLYRCLKLLFVVGLFVVLLMNTHNLFASFQKNELTDRRFINLNKCPACFGTSWCRKFMNGQVSFETWGRLRFLDVFNVKNVYFAQYGEPREGTRRVVLKRLGSNQELAEIDQKICKRATGRPRCDLIQAMYKTEFARINGDVRLLTPEVVEGWSDLVHCPSQRLLDRVVRRYAETKDSGSFLLKNLKDTERMQLLMTLAFNPEPLVLQTQICALPDTPLPLSITDLASLHRSTSSFNTPASPDMGTYPSEDKTGSYLGPTPFFWLPSLDGGPSGNGRRGGGGRGEQRVTPTVTACTPAYLKPSLLKMQFCSAGES
ncbi:unnamed protein product [Pleuronectes platessa]|uniref:Uncharacterized protein n=1 Tax=Pleuronectes platessa TaxID=8262 RepID=A0A9N7YB45_PLEPL|nr:unnamed protein product [Pleuronectes platessa]